MLTFLCLLNYIYIVQITILLWPHCNSSNAGGEIKAALPLNFSWADDHCWQQSVVNMKSLCNVFLRRHSNSSSSNNWSCRAEWTEKGSDAALRRRPLSHPEIWATIYLSAVNLNAISPRISTIIKNFWLSPKCLHGRFNQTVSFRRGIHK